MGIIARIFGRKRITEFSPQELRLEEKRLEIRENQLIGKIDRYEKLKQELFNQGAKTGSLERRRVYARKFSEYSKLINIYETELLRVSKELATVNIIRMVTERRKGRKEKPILAKLRDKDIAKIQVMLEDDKINREVYLEHLNETLGVLADETYQISAELGKEESEVMKIWEKMDEGELSVEDAYKDMSGKKVKEKDVESM
jgi:hypothetical protein